MTRLALVVLALVTAGCGPIEYVSTVTMQATRAIADARSARAPELSPYEYTLAVEELHKSRELAGHARWEQAIKFGKAALDDARRAHELAAEKASKSPEAQK